MSLITVFIAFLAVLSYCSCDFLCGKDQNNLVCSASEQFNILQRGTVSDDETTQSVSLYGCGITSIEVDSFANIPNLDTLDLSSNLLSTIELGTFDQLHDVQNLNITRNFMSEIPLGLFNDLVSLRILDLSENQLAQIASDMFNTNEELHWLSLAKNIIRELPLELFNKNTKLTQLNLSHNQLREIPFGVFDNLRYLRVLDLSSNQLSNLAPEVFNYNSELLKLYLSNIGLQNVPEGYVNIFQQLILLDLSNNYLTGIREDIFGALVNVKNLNLSGNQLTEITSLYGLPQIVTLDVSRNRLQYLPIFNAATIRHIDISHNLFTNFGSNLGMHLPRRLSVLRLHGNPWQCSCLNQLLTVLQRRKISYAIGSFFNGKKPICAVIPKRVARCFREPSQDQYFFNTYFGGLQKYQN